MSYSYAVIESVKRQIAEMRDRMARVVVSGSPADYPEYREWVGKLWALSEVYSLIEETETELGGALPRKG